MISKLVSCEISMFLLVLLSVAEQAGLSLRVGHPGDRFSHDEAHNIYEQWHEISNNVVCEPSKGSDQPAQTCSLIRAFARRLNIL